MCFFVGGLRRSEQLYNSLVAQTSASMMTVSVASLLIPAAFHATFPAADLDEESTLKISRGSSIILLLVYFSYTPNRSTLI
jgi:Ca2+:H+ antiporter